MSWELIVIGCLLLLITGIAWWTMRKDRRSELNVFGTNTATIDSDVLAQKIASAVGVEMREVMKEIADELLKHLKALEFTTSKDRHVTHDQQGRDQISMDESIIPTNVSLNVGAANFEGAATEEKVVDTRLDKSKSRLAGVFKGRKKE